MLHKITEIISIQPFLIECVFDKIEKRKIDLADWIAEFKTDNNGWTSLLADPNYFVKAKLASYGTLCWDNEVDFDPNVLYIKSEPI